MAPTIDPILVKINNLREELRARGVPVSGIIDEMESNAFGLNVWLKAEDRYPTDTVWLTRAAPITYRWGPKFEHELDGETPIAEVASAVQASLG